MGGRGHRPVHAKKTVDDAGSTPGTLPAIVPTSFPGVCRFCGRPGRVVERFPRRGYGRGVDGGYVLIGGYRRVELLRRLGRDTGYAMVLSMDEASALLFAYRLERSGRRSALEEGWLLKELGSVHGMGREALSRALLRSTSWIRRRLGLVEGLPGAVQDAGRAGWVPRH